MNKEAILRSLRDRGNAMELRMASLEVRNDKDVVLEAVSLTPTSLQYASKELKNDKDVVTEAVRRDGVSFYYASDELKNDRDFILSLLDIDKKLYFFEYISDDAKQDYPFVEYVLTNRIAILESMLRRGLTKDKGFHQILDTVPEILIKKWFMMVFITKDPSILPYLCTDLKMDKDIVLTAIRNCFPEEINDVFSGMFVEDHPPTFLDEDIAMALVLKEGTLLSKMPQMNNNLSIAIAAISQNGRAVDSVSPGLNIRQTLKTLVDNHKKAMLLLKGSQDPSSSLRKLNQHGPHFAQIFRKTIAKNAGILFPPEFDFDLVMKAARNIGIQGGTKRKKNKRKTRK
jgi:hypothetical protein